MSFRTRFGIYALYLVQMLKQVQHDNTFVAEIIYSCGGFNTPTLCVEIKGIESDCNTL